MNTIDMIFEYQLLVKSSVTLVTCVTFQFFMNTVNVYLEISFQVKSFVTKVTFVIFYLFMEIVDMILDILQSGKCFATKFTFVNFQPLHSAAKPYILRKSRNLYRLRSLNLVKIYWKTNQKCVNRALYHNVINFCIYKKNIAIEFE